MLINLRNALMAGKRLPYDAEVEYLEIGNTKCRIRTGLYLPESSVFKITVDADSPATSQEGAFVSRYASGYVGFVMMNSYGVPKLFNMTEFRGYSCEGRHTYEFIGDGSSVFKFKFDTKTINVNRRSDWAGGSNSITLFQTSDRTSQYAIPGTKFYSIQFEFDGVKVLDLIPVRKDGEGFMFNKVSWQFMSDDYDGVYIVGPDTSATRGGGISAYA